MILTKTRGTDGPEPRARRRGTRRTAFPARSSAAELRARLVRAVRRADRQSLRRVVAAGLPIVWGAIAITYKLACPLAQRNGIEARVVTSAVFFVVGTGLILQVRHALLRELRQIRKIAGAAQDVVLRPLPPWIDGLSVAATQLSADRGAILGGDLYEAIATEYGVRVIMGDVRGHGLGAIGTVAAVLGSFREAVHDEPDLGRVLLRLERALARHLRERARAEHPAEGADPEGPFAEEFVTVLLLEIRADGEMRALNCAHPWPYLLRGGIGPVGERGEVVPLSTGEPMPPLGPFPLPAELSDTAYGPLLPGDALVLHTDGVEDARDAHGRFFPLPAALGEAVRAAPVPAEAVLSTVFAGLLRHTRGRPTDDVALLILRNDRPCRRHGEPVGHQVRPR
ncbi:PP2C family protein-serine/threonine phosphatase [Streptomyces sp. NPDC059785]|uniref:PP2C family protein-serine/threonine phosphatase n=1 Tax=unclassified Streptomyces TaxID=2593676 RepID=UPI0036497C3B